MDFQKQNLIEFSFTHHKYIFTLSIENLLNDNSKSLHTKIKEECEKHNIIVYEDNIKLYDIENNVKIEKAKPNMPIITSIVLNGLVVTSSNSVSADGSFLLSSSL